MSYLSQRLRTLKTVSDRLVKVSISRKDLTDNEILNRVPLINHSIYEVTVIDRGFQERNARVVCVVDYT